MDTVRVEARWRNALARGWRSASQSAAVRVLFVVLALILLPVVLFAVFNPPTTYYQWSESQRLGGVDQQWVKLDEVAPVLARSIVAAEDANFCQHFGLDIEAIRRVLERGEGRGASTISQQLVKNVYLWPRRSWWRKGLEAGLTPVVELVWTKRRILEVYLNVAEFDEGVFGVGAAARHYFGVDASQLNARQSARLATVLPSPKKRSASQPTAFLLERAVAIQGGAETLRADGRAACFS